MYKTIWISFIAIVLLSSLETPTYAIDPEDVYDGDEIIRQSPVPAFPPHQIHQQASCFDWFWQMVKNFNISSHPDFERTMDRIR